MGSTSSKTRRLDGAGSSCSSFSSSVSSLAILDGAGSSNSNRRGFGARSLFHSSCLGSTSRTYDSDDDIEIPNPIHEENGIIDCGQQMQRDELISNGVKIECYRNIKVEQPDEMACVSSNVDLTEWIQASDNDVSGSASGSPPPTSSSQPLNLSSRFRSCFNMAPGNVSFRLSRASSLRSVRADLDSPINFTIDNSREDSHMPAHPSIGSIDRYENQEGSHLHPNSSNISPRRYYSSGSPVNVPLNPSSSVVNCPIISTRSLARDNIGRRTRGDACSPYSRNHIEVHNVNERHVDGRNATREPMDRNSRFSRTLSVGRLRDRVLRRPSFSDLAFPHLEQERVATDFNEVQGVNARSATVEENPAVSLASSYQGYNSENADTDASQLRESRLNDIVQQRSNFLERQRRIRSRVRALQRSRFETLSGHERSCILSGHHRTGRCTCHMNARGPNSTDDTGARASISRIVMLAEALFEQSAALPSQPSVSSIGSIPAPSEAVESLPLKIYSKSTKLQSDEAGQCYICLVEYEDGDDMRILPCHHEFHRACVDKWLKEIHRVCPLCRGDVCRFRV